MYSLKGITVVFSSKHMMKGYYACLQIKQSGGNMHHRADSTTTLCHDRMQECEC